MEKFYEKRPILYHYDIILKTSSSMLDGEAYICDLMKHIHSSKDISIDIVNGTWESSIIRRNDGSKMSLVRCEINLECDSYKHNKHVVMHDIEDRLSNVVNTFIDASHPLADKTFDRIDEIIIHSKAYEMSEADAYLQNMQKK